MTISYTPQNTIEETLSARVALCSEKITRILDRFMFLGRGLHPTPNLTKSTQPNALC